jgi:hypothetical protein
MLREWLARSGSPRVRVDIIPVMPRSYIPPMQTDPTRGCSRRSVHARAESEMKRSSLVAGTTTRRSTACLVAGLAVAAAVIALIAGQDRSHAATPSGATVASPPSAGNRLTPEEMRKAKPFPLPSIDRPPVAPPINPAPPPDARPGVSSPGGLGGPPVGR